MRFDVCIVSGKAFDAVAVHWLFANPLERLALHLLVERHTAGNHLLPRLRGIAAIRERRLRADTRTSPVCKTCTWKASLAVPPLTWYTRPLWVLSANNCATATRRLRKSAPNSIFPTCPSSASLSRSTWACHQQNIGSRTWIMNADYILNKVNKLNFCCCFTNSIASLPVRCSMSKRKTRFPPWPQTVSRGYYICSRTIRK